MLKSTKCLLENEIYSLQNIVFINKLEKLCLFYVVIQRIKYHRIVKTTGHEFWKKRVNTHCKKGISWFEEGNDIYGKIWTLLQTIFQKIS